MNAFDASSFEAPEQVASHGEPVWCSQDLIEDYLDHLCAPLVGIVPFHERDRLRQEAAFNIEGRAKQYELDGYDSTESASRAIDKYGRSDQLSESFLREWLKYQPKGIIARKLGLPTTYATFFFGQTALWCLVLIQLSIYLPDPQPYTFGLKLWEIRKVIPEPLPLPDRNPLFACFWILCLVAPVIAGWLTGRKALIGATSAVPRVVLICSAVSLTVGLMILPTTEGLWLALVQLIWWVPCGTLVAHLASALARRRHVRFHVPKNLWRKRL